MLYITGDIHGERARFADPSYGIEGRISEGDRILVCGDFVNIFHENGQAEIDAFLDELEQKPYEILFCDGNHEDYSRLSSYPKEQWMGGSIHRIRRNIRHLMRGQIYEIDGSTFFVLGGGRSFGTNPPLIEGQTWWPREEPSEEEYREARTNLERCGWQVDYIVTHTAPLETMRMVAPDYEAGILNSFLDWLQQKVTYGHWFMGHLHQDQDVWRNQTVLHYEVRELQK